MSNKDKIDKWFDHCFPTDLEAKKPECEGTCVECKCGDEELPEHFGIVQRAPQANIYEVIQRLEKYAGDTGSQEIYINILAESLVIIVAAVSAELPVKERVAFFDAGIISLNDGIREMADMVRKRLESYKEPSEKEGE